MVKEKNEANTAVLEKVDNCVFVKSKSKNYKNNEDSIITIVGSDGKEKDIKVKHVTYQRQDLLDILNKEYCLIKDEYRYFLDKIINNDIDFHKSDYQFVLNVIEHLKNEFLKRIDIKSWRKESYKKSRSVISTDEDNINIIELIATHKVLYPIIVSSEIEYNEDYKNLVNYVFNKESLIKASNLLWKIAMLRNKFDIDKMYRYYTSLENAVSNAELYIWINSAWVENLTLLKYDTLGENRNFYSYFVSLVSHNLDYFLKKYDPDSNNTFAEVQAKISSLNNDITTNFLTELMLKNLVNKITSDKKTINILNTYQYTPITTFSIELFSTAINIPFKTIEQYGFYIQYIIYNTILSNNTLTKEFKSATNLFQYVFKTVHENKKNAHINKLKILIMKSDIISKSIILDYIDKFSVFFNSELVNLTNNSKVNITKQDIQDSLFDFFDFYSKYITDPVYKAKINNIFTKHLYSFLS